MGPVDVIANHMAGTVVYNHPETANIMDDWIDHPNGFIGQPFCTSLISKKKLMPSDYSHIAKNE